MIGVVALLYGTACVAVTNRSAHTAVTALTALLAVSVVSFVLFMAHGGVGVGYLGVLLPGALLFQVRKPPLRDWLGEAGT